MGLVEILLGILSVSAFAIGLAVTPLAIHAADFDHARLAFWCAGALWPIAFLVWLKREESSTISGFNRPALISR